MITHNSNLDRLLDIDHVVFPSINVTSFKVKGKKRTDLTVNYFKLQTKVPVKGRDGKNYYVPVIKDFKGHNTFEQLHKLFSDACEIIRDQFITTEGKDVLMTDYLKIKHLSADEITKEA